MLSSREIGLFSDPHDLGSPHIWAIKLCANIDACQVMSLV